VTTTASKTPHQRSDASTLHAPTCQQTEIGVIPLDWQVVRLEEISAFITKGSTPTTYGFHWERSGVLFLRSECVSENGLDLNQSMFISPQAHAFLRRSEVQDGDILITITGNVGRVVMLSGVGKANLNQHIARVRITSNRVDPRFVYYYLSRPDVRAHFAKITTGQAYPQISLKQVREALIPIPRLEEQRAIADALEDVSANILALESNLRKSQAIRDAMMQGLLTGKVRLA
jgi:type I restriction enzyme S subunit